MTHYFVTEENIEDVKANMVAMDQKADLEVGCETWSITYAGGQVGEITVWPKHNRAAVFFGADSEWGDWDAEARTITMEDGTVLDEYGDHVVEDEGSGEDE